MKTNATSLTVQAPDQAHHAQMLDLVAKTFSTWFGYFGFLEHCRRGYIDHSHYDPTVSAIGILDGQVVTNWSIYDYRMRIGRCLVRVGGVGVVSTHADYRRRGLMIPTGKASIAAMRPAGYDLSILFGLHNFYHRFGYVRGWSQQAYTIAVGDLPAATAAPALRKFRLGARADIDALYNRACSRLTGTALRPTYTLARIDPSGKPGSQGYLWTDRAGKLAGYVHVALRGSQLDCGEAIGQPDEVLAVLGKLASRLHATEIRLGCLHYDSPLAVAIRRLTCRMETQYVRNGGAMVRIINLRSSLEKIAPELSRRLAASAHASWKGRLLIVDGREKVAFDIDRSKVALASSLDTRHTIRGGEHIAQLLIGTDRPEEIAEAGAIRLAGDAKTLLPTLFPNQRPMLANWDYF
jgi:predicted acetyltransferase